ncbi:hypothetical protein BCR35DRAFT_333886 [Leucosporidium creatinivorum]|uniref:Uncharacterized protein n=1 Tax=Leucosporidium creatinivorum TaxID=106004 RepID=A0A1Y2EN19_9BASI|nr:hypothetical protein BCR35DRAFT_333886 [Leucosporidium creatinivorum]
MSQPFPSNSPPTSALRRPFPLPRASTELPANSKATRFSFPKSPDVDEEDGPTRQREASTVSPPRHLLMRSRRVSSPANLVQTNTHSVAESGGSYFGAAGNRMSVASMASMSSFDSLPEEDEEATTPDGGVDATGRPPLLRRSVSPTRPTPLPRPASFAPSGSARPANPKRNSLPTPPVFDGSYRPFSLGPMPMIRSTSRSSSRGRASPLGKKATKDPAAEAGRKGTAAEREQERVKREEKRWNVAEELRETERAYVNVLEEINDHYYQPLLNALPLNDPLHRRASTRTSVPSAPTSPIIRPTLSPRTSVYAPQPLTDMNRSRTSTVESTQSTSSTTTATSTDTSTSISSASTSVGSLPILARKEIGEIFSNFTDVLNISHEMLAALDDAIPDRPSQPVPLSTRPSLAHLPSLSPPTSLSGSPEPDLCSSAGTEDSDGIHTPLEGDLSQEDDSRRRRTMSSGKRERRPPAPPLGVGKAILPILPFLKQYSFFVSNFSASLARLSGLEASLSAPVVSGLNGSTPSSVEDRVRWQAFCEERRSMGAGRNLGLGGMLLNIVQRVPRYRLLLADLIKLTERDHPDLKDLTKAWETVDSVATHLDSQIHAYTSDLQILDLQRSFTNLDAPLLSPGRRLLKSGTLRKLDRRGKEQVRTFFLFNDVLIHASGGDMGGWLGMTAAPAKEDQAAMKSSHAGSGAGSGSAGQAQYRLHRRFLLEDITVVGEDSTEKGREHGFQVLSSEKSFAVYADNLDDKTSWIDALRDAKANLLRDRRTLQRDDDTSSSLSSDVFHQRSNTTRRERRISLPVTSSNTHRHFLSPQASLPTPQLGVIPATPIDEPTRFITDSPASIATIDRSSQPTSPLELEGEKSFLGGGKEEGESATKAQEYRVIDNYSAPVWVPDSKAERCMKCNDPFSLWKRRHHCRLCGSVVCFSCSDNFFIIPPSATEPNRPDLLARACDPCYSTVFPPDSPTDELPSPSPTTSRNPIQRAPFPSVNILSPPSSPPIAFREIHGEEGIPTFSLSPEEPDEGEKRVMERVVGSPTSTPRKERETARGKLEAVLKR